MGEGESGGEGGGKGEGMGEGEGEGEAYRRVNEAFVPMHTSARLFVCLCRIEKREGREIRIESAPTGPFPAARRASFMSVIREPTTGEEAYEGAVNAG